MFHKFFRASSVAVSLFLLAASSLRGGTLSTPAVDNYNVRVGTETFAALYKFTTNTALVETAEAMTNMGANVIKFYMGANASGQAGVTLPSGVTNLIEEARDCPSYRQVLAMPFKHFIMWEYPFANSDEWWGSGYNATAGAKDYREMYDLACYLLTNFNNSGKTFYLGHWEGDGYLEVNGWTTNPSPATISGMIGWLNNRQKAVDDAKAATAHTNVFVYNYAECNRVRDAMNNGTNNNQRVINYVVPYVTNLDYLSYSSYDAQNLSSSDLYTTLNYMQAHLPTNKISAVPGCRMWIGEYGWGYDSFAGQEPLTRTYIQRLLGWNYNGNCLQYILFWEMYNNQGPDLAPKTNYCLINPDDIKEPCYYLHQYFLNEAKMLTAQYLETTGALPSDTQFSSMVSPMLNNVLAAPVNITLASASAAAVGDDSALVSATLAQGVYGDDQAVMSVYWGTQNGGTNPAAWQNSQVIGANTNFNPATFAATLTNLAPATLYYVSILASNASAQVWASAGSVITGKQRPQLNPNNYAYRAKISFPGYTGAPLANFPALITLSPSNIAGLNYSQFQAGGSDLRFTDDTGTGMLPYEIDEWNQSGVSTLWVQVPVLNGSDIWAYWGNPNDTDVSPASSNVWVNANYKIVYHMKEGALPFADSTGQFPANRGVAPAATPGAIGHAAYFNGTSDYISPGPVALSNQFTTYAWVNLNASDNNIQTIWANQMGGYGSNGFSWFIDTYKTSDRITHFDSGNGAGSGADPTSPNTVSFGQWHFLTATWDRQHTTVNNYLDGNLNGSGTAVGTFALNNQINIGAFLDPDFYMTGAIDEARIQSGIASPAWITATYENMAAPNTFYSYSSANFGPPRLEQDISPANQIVSLPGIDTVTYAAGVSGAAPFSYQWYQNGLPVAGATNSAFTFTALSGTNTYFVTVTNAFTASEAGGIPVTSGTATVIGAPTLSPTNFAYRMRISFPGYTGSSTLTNFPALVQFSNALPGFAYAQFASPTGGDLRFADESGLLPLPYEINQWNHNGLSSIWVQAPELSGTNSFIWAYWGNSLDTNPPAHATNGAVWLPQYQLVWHLEQNSFPYADSTTQFPAISGITPALTAGEIGFGGLFDGSTSYLQSAPVNVGGAFTLFAWVKTTGANNIQTIWANKPAGWNTDGFSLYVNTYNTSDGRLLLEDGDGTTGLTLSSTAAAVSSGSWHSVAATVNRTLGSAQLFVDGSPVGSGSCTTDFANDNALQFGRFNNSVYYFNGTMDEARIANGICSADWIKATSANTASPGTFNSNFPINQAPALQASNSANGQVLSWPASSGVFTLYTTTNLSAGAGWIQATNVITYTNGQWQTTVPASSNASQFFRLQTR